jgi:lipase maturation factor 1
MSWQLPAADLALTLLPRLLGVVYLVAFASLLVQVRGLYGPRGLLPIGAYLARLRQTYAKDAWRLCPSLFWWGSGERALVGAALAGVLLSGLLIAGAWPLPLLLALWLLYLSFAAVGQAFLSFQWDALLLEAGFLILILTLAGPSPLAALAAQLFIFRFMLSAGVVKLTSGDPTWRDLTALCHHYQTQPLPNRFAWYLHQLPVPLQRFSTLATFCFELAVPLLLLGPAPLRLAGCILLILFQGLLLLSGSYGFFNLLTIVLCVPLLDDRYLAPLLPHLGAAPAAGPVAVLCGDPLLLGLLLLNLLQLLRLFIRPRWLEPLFASLQPWWISSPYGLFAVMTTRRLEFVIEGSADGESWHPYPFRWKPGDPARAPRQAAPHMPRLDWQMWFAALNPAHLEPWLQTLLRRLLESAPPVLALLGKTPFAAAPTYLRLKLYDYRFSDRTERRRTGDWWVRTPAGTGPPLRLPENGGTGLEEVRLATGRHESATGDW